MKMYFFRHFLGPDWPSQRWCSSCSSLHLDRWLKKTLFLFVFQISFSLYGLLESIFFSLGGHLSQLSAKQAWTNVPREKGNKKTTFWSRLFSPRANYFFFGMSPLQPELLFFSIHKQLPYGQKWNVAIHVYFRNENIGFFSSSYYQFSVTIVFYFVLPIL